MTRLSTGLDNNAIDNEDIKTLLMEVEMLLGAQNDDA